MRALERVSGLSASQAKHLLLKELEDQIRHDSARLVRQVEDETKRAHEGGKARGGTEEPKKGERGGGGAAWKNLGKDWDDDD